MTDYVTISKAEIEALLSNLEEKYHNQWRETLDSHSEGMSDGVANVRAEISALLDKAPSVEQKPSWVCIYCFGDYSFHHPSVADVFVNDYILDGGEPVKTELYTSPPQAELEKRIAELEKDTRRLDLLMSMSGEMYAESVKYQFVGRLREFIDANQLHIEEAMEKTNE